MLGLRALDQVPEAVLIAAPDGAIVYANQTARDQWGLSGVTSSLEMLFSRIAPHTAWEPLVENLPHRHQIATVRGDVWLTAETYRASDANFIQITIQPTEGFALSGEAAPGQQRKILLEASRAIASTWEQSQVLQILVGYGLEMGGVAGAVFYQYDQVNHTLAELVGMSAAGDPINAGASIAREGLSPVEGTLNQAEPVVLEMNEAQSWPTPAEFGEGPFSILVMALTLHDEPYGLLALFQPADAPTFSVDLKDSLEILLSQTGLAIENARLFSDTYQRESFSNALGRVSLATSATLDLESVLNLICQESITTFEVDGIYIWQRDQEELVGIAALGYGADAFLQSKIPLEDPNTFSAVISRTGEATFINHLQDNESLTLALPQKYPIRSVLGIPLRREEETIGVLVLVDNRTAEKFNQRDVSRALQFGGQAAIAIQNAQLVRELRTLNEDLDGRVAQRTFDLERERDRVQFLLRITTELAASLDEDRVLNRALELVNEIVNATESMILLINPETDMFHYRAILGSKMSLPPGGLSTGLRRTEGVSGWLLNNREALIAANVHTDERWPTIPADISADYHSALGVPLFSGDDAIGVLLFFHKEKNAFSQQQLELVEAVAVQVANAIGNAQLYFFIQDQAEQIGNLLREEQKEAAKSEAILESLSDGLLVVDDTGRVILANSALAQMLALPDENLVGRQVQDMMGIYGASGMQWSETIADWANNSDQIDPSAFLTDELYVEGRIINVRLSPVFNTNDFLGTVSMFRDITKAVEVDRIKSEFVSNVSHELRTPMTSIKGYTDLMLMGAAGDMSEPQRHYLTVIKNNADRLKSLVDDLLDISRIETGKTKLIRTQLDIGEVVREIADDHLPGRIQDAGKEMLITKEIPADLPLISADREKVTRILTNLVDNAFNYTPAGGTIHIDARIVDQDIAVTVSDTGIGIPEEHLDNIYDRFYRSESDQVRSVPGTGLGLAIVQSLVEMHGGSMSVKSQVGEGSSFTVFLPLNAKESGEPMGLEHKELRNV